jgi:L-threonylcarbamoyladenylate synthase
MRIVSVDPGAPDAAAVRDAARLLREGGLVAFPTETVYGLGANALDARAVERIYVAKGRPSFNPLIVHLADVTQVERVARDWPERAAALARAFWPGPLTMVVPKRAGVPDSVTAGLPSVAVRIPSHPVAHAILAAADIPVAAPSANRSTMVSPTTAQHVAKSLGDRVDLIVDGGPTTVGIESTVVDLTTDSPVLLRPGAISPEQLGAVLGVAVPRATAEAGDASDAPRASPGMMERHYAPRARVVLCDAADVADAIDEEARGGSVGAMVVRARAGTGTLRVQMPADAARYAARLYATLHALDDAGVNAIVIERVPSSADWDAVRDRLQRAARNVSS